MHDRMIVHRLAFVFAFTGSVSAWIPQYRQARLPCTSLDAAVGIFYGTSTGNTFDCAEMIYKAFGSDIAAEPIDIDSLDAEEVAAAFGEHGALVVGTPTWNTGAETERSGTGWDEIYYTKLPEMKNVLTGKKVAVFGLGDQSSYSANYADGMGELFDVFENLGCVMVDGSWSQEGYEHEASKSIRGDKFCGLALDQINQDDLTEERIEQWVDQLKSVGILDGIDSVAVSAATSTTTEKVSNLKIKTTEPQIQVEKLSAVLDTINESQSSGGFTPHFNPKTGKTLWTSPDGRKSYITTE